MFRNRGAGKTKVKNGKHPRQKSGRPKQGNDLSNSTRRKILSDWLYDHLSCPFPTVEEMRKLSMATNLPFDKLSNWFTRTRLRFLKPCVAKPWMV